MSAHSGEISCLLSHISLRQSMVDQRLSHIAIFEDVVILGESAHQFLTSMHWVSAHIDVLKLEKFADAAKMKLSSECVHANRKIRQLIGQHLGAAGFIQLKKRFRVI